jgi:hypothetical protein
MSKITKCSVCFSSNLIPVFRNFNLPIYCLDYSPSREEALKSEGADVSFVQCNDCGFLFNSTYKQLNYEVDYTADRSNSGTFNKYLANVAEKLIKSIKTKVSKIVEVGAGDCQFSEELSINMPNVEFSCYDPSWKNSEKNGKINKIASIYENQKEYPDLIIARHVLEHQFDVHGFIKSISKERPEYIFIEVPCSSYVLNNNYQDFSYPHCSYLDFLSLNILMDNNGYFAKFQEHVFNEEYVIALYKKKSLKKNTYDDQFLKWKKRLLSKINKNDIIWGAAGKGVMMMNILGLDYNNIPYVVDANPDISGKFFPISGNQIIHPSKLKKYVTKNSKIIVMNKLYLEEIEKELLKLEINANTIFIGDL